MYYCYLLTKPPIILFFPAFSSDGSITLFTFSTYNLLAVLTLYREKKKIFFRKGTSRYMNMRNNTQVRRSGRSAPYRPVRVENKAPSDCGSVRVPENYPSLAMVYTVSQCWRLVSDGCEGFDRGTIFDELNKPFYGDKCCKNGGCCK